MRLSRHRRTYVRLCAVFEYICIYYATSHLSVDAYHGVFVLPVELTEETADVSRVEQAFTEKWARKRKRIVSRTAQSPLSPIPTTTR